MKTHDWELLAAHVVFGLDTADKSLKDWHPVVDEKQLQRLFGYFEADDMTSELRRSKYIRFLCKEVECDWPSDDGLWKLVNATPEQKLIALVKAAQACGGV